MNQATTLFFDLLQIEEERGAMHIMSADKTVRNGLNGAASLCVLVPS